MIKCGVFAWVCVVCEGIGGAGARPRPRDGCDFLRRDVLLALHEPLLFPQDCTVFETENKILHVVSPASSSSCRIFLPCCSDSRGSIHIYQTEAPVGA